MIRGKGFTEIQSQRECQSNVCLFYMDGPDMYSNYLCVLLKKAP